MEPVTFGAILAMGYTECVSRLVSGLYGVHVSSSQWAESVPCSASVECMSRLVSGRRAYLVLLVWSAKLALPVGSECMSRLVSGAY